MKKIKNFLKRRYNKDAKLQTARILAKFESVEQTFQDQGKIPSIPIETQNITKPAHDKKFDLKSKIQKVNDKKLPFTKEVIGSEDLIVDFIAQELSFTGAKISEIISLSDTGSININFMIRYSGKSKTLHLAIDGVKVLLGRDGGQVKLENYTSDQNIWSLNYKRNLYPLKKIIKLPPVPEL